MKCPVHDCEKDVVVGGLCRSHYDRVRRLQKWEGYIWKVEKVWKDKRDSSKLNFTVTLFDIKATICGIEKVKALVDKVVLKVMREYEN